MTVRVQTEPFDIGQEIAALNRSDAGSGATVTFTGTVRGSSNGIALKSMTLEHYPAMTQTALEAIEREARTRWQLDDCLIVHRHGTLLPGDDIVLVIATSKHRADAFNAAAFAMDALKTSAPFWKREETSDGRSHWVDARGCDTKASDRWKTS